MNQRTAQFPETPPVTAEQVTEYLNEHPGFFNDHLNLLEKMTVPHPSGAAVSLVTKQIELLRQKNRRLQRQLSELVDIARDNDNLFSRMHQLTLALIDAGTLEDTLASLDHVLHECFLADFVALRMFKEETSPSIGNLFVPPADPNLEHFSSTLESRRPKCGQPTLAQAAFLFGDSAAEVLSCAIIPLFCEGVNGLLAIGSRHEDRFHHSMGHLFLTQLGEIVSTKMKTFILDRP